MTQSNISIILPALNEESNIPLIFDRLSKILEGENYELIFIDDGSSDQTFAAIKRLSARHSQVKGLSLSRNFGHQAALKAGLDYAQGDCVVSLDCDLEHPPEHLTQMLEVWRTGTEVVISRRDSSTPLPFFKKWTSKGFYALLNLISEIPVEPETADFRLLDRKVVNACRAITENELFWRGLIPWLGFKTKVLRYPQANRQHGKSKYTVTKMIKFSMTGITSFSIRPLYLSLYLGALLSLSSFSYLVYALWIRFFTEEGVSGWASMIASILLIGGVQLLILGVMGVYLGKLFIQSKGRPQYVLREIVDPSRAENELKRTG
jgi:polyisoprenyl-phosphate glycosyltransferase